MNDQELLNTLGELYGKIMGTPVDSALIAKDTRLKEDLGINSVALIYLVVAIEEQFGISMAEVSFNTFTTLGDVVEYIKSKC